jgi:DNA-binding cell septation regulator SpoVG
MEVHAHTHTARKKWTHYFWEFLMLFLAVFCGFLAEYQLEHKIEKDRERQYMKSMLEDLVSDTSMLQRTIQRAAAMEKGLDSLKNNLYDLDSVEKNILNIYRQNAVNERLILVSFSDQTAIQLRNSGGMRLIRKIKIANAISRYWRGINGIEFTLDNFKKVSDEREDLGHAIFNRKYNVRLSNDSSTSLDNYYIIPGARLMTNDKNLLINYANRTGRLQEFIERFIMHQLISQKLRAIDLIDLIKKEYHLK